MSKISSTKLKKLITLMLLAVGSFVIINQFYLEPRKKRAEYDAMRQEAEARQKQSPIPGKIKAINYKEGQQYEKGALLMSLDEEDIVLRMKRVEAGVNKAQTAVTMAEQRVAEHQKLFEIGAIPKTTMDKVQLELDSSGYDLKAAQLEYKQTAVTKTAVTVGYY